MRRNKNILQWFTENTDMEGEPLPGQSIVEICSDSRVLIENHCGVKAYNAESVCINLKFGTVSVFGRNLELRQMSKEQLVIYGCIDRIDLCRRKN